jgi:hypothetical protein
VEEDLFFSHKKEHTRERVRSFDLVAGYFCPVFFRICSAK